jgi:hypothetical protein
MGKVTKVCIGASIAIFAALLIAAMVFHIDIARGLTGVGFFFVVGLPLYIAYRIGEKRDTDERTAAMDDLYVRFDKCSEVVDEIEERLGDSIEAFKIWGWYIKDLEKTDENAYYAEVALSREAGMDTERLSSAGYGKDVSHLIDIRRKLKDIRYLL